MFNVSSSQQRSPEERRTVEDEFKFDKDIGREIRAEKIDEINDYIKEGCEEELTYQEMVEYWENHKLFKQLYKMSKKYTYRKKVDGRRKRLMLNI